MTTIEVSNRAYDFIRQFTIKSVKDALVELITNSVDAYNKNNMMSKQINIEYHSDGYLYVYDQAIGLTASQMETCFLKVGDYTNYEGARGFFSRGAKDISALGDLQFVAIKDNKYSICNIYYNLTYDFPIKDVDITNEIRQQYKITNNGLSVRISLLSNFMISDTVSYINSIHNIAVLRDIFMDDNVIVSFGAFENNLEIYSKIIKFSYPYSQLLLQLEYNVPNYDTVTAKFVVNQTYEKMPQPSNEKDMIFGFLLKSASTIYEVSTIDDRYRWDPYMNYIYGYLQCDHISTLLYDYDLNGPSEKNPFPIIDPSRITGVNIEHPFIINLLSIPKVRLDQILRELNTSISNQSINIKEVNQLLDELSKYGLNIIEEEEIQVSFIPDYDSALAKAIEDDRLNYVTSEKSYLLTNNYSTGITDYDQQIQELLVNIESESPYFAVDAELNVINLPSFIDTDNIGSTLELLTDDQQHVLEQNPYIYKLESDGTLMKLYIFEKGVLSNVTNPENEYVIVKNKKFTISFFNDINIESRYLIDYNDGVHIKLNLNNLSIQKYLVTPNIENGLTDVTIENLGSSNSLTFLQELIIDILSQVILENDIMKGKLQLDSSNFNNTKKISIYKNAISVRIEPYIATIFDNYIKKIVDSKLIRLNYIMDQIGNSVSEVIDLNTQGGEIVLLKSQLDSLLAQLLD